METDQEFSVFKKLLIFGSPGSGKTSLTERLDKNYFVDTPPSIEGIFHTFLIILYLSILYRNNTNKTFKQLHSFKSITFKYY